MPPKGGTTYLRPLFLPKKKYRSGFRVFGVFSGKKNTVLRFSFSVFRDEPASPISFANNDRREWFISNFEVPER